MAHLIWKLEVPVHRLLHVDVSLPPLARVVHVDQQRPDTVEFWFRFCKEYHHDGMGERRRFRVFGTGWDISEQWEYVGTALDRKNGLVWHLHEWKGKLSE